MVREAADEQLDKARESIGQALDLLRSCPELPCAEATRFDLSAALSAAEDVDGDPARGVRHLGHAMDGLRAALARMQDACEDRPELEPATKAIARAMAVLFPLVPKAPSAPPDSGDAPLPLVRRAPTGAVEEPLPLTARRAEPEIAEAPLPLTSRRSDAARAEPDRRSRARRDIHAELGIQSGTNFYTGFARDISSGGLFVATYDIPRAGTEVNVNFSLPGGPTLSLHGTVRWIREPDDRDPDLTPGMGVAFERLDPAAARAINAYLADHAPLFFEE
jgi:uncharacterized protein (TIGR02266 family)